MKKQNTLKMKPSDIKYEPIVQPKLPMYIRSIEHHKTGKTSVVELLIMGLIVLFIFSLGIILGI